MPETIKVASGVAMSQQGVSLAQTKAGIKPSGGLNPDEKAAVAALFKAPDPAPAPAPDPAKPASNVKTPAPAPEPTAKPSGTPEPAKVPVAPAAPLDLDADTLLGDDHVLPSKAEQWKTYKKIVTDKLAAAEAERDMLKKQLGELGDPTALKNIAKERDELQTLLRTVALQHDPEFKARFDSRRKVFVDEAREAVGAEHAAEVSSILKRHGGNAHALLREWSKTHELDGWQTQTLLSAVRGLRELEVSREEAIRESTANWEKNSTQLTLAAQRQAEAAAAEVRQAVESRLSLAREKNPLFKEREGDDEWNTAVAQATQRVAQFALGVNLDADTRSGMAMQAASFPLLGMEYMKLQAAYKELQKKAAGLAGSAPANGSSGEPGSRPAVTPEEAAKMSVGQQILAGMRAQGLSLGK